VSGPKAPPQWRPTEKEGCRLGGRSHWFTRRRGQDCRQRASRHLVKDESLLHDASVCGSTDSLTLPDGSSLAVTKGSNVLRGIVDRGETSITISNVYYAPSLAHNLLSLGQLVKRGCALHDVLGHLVITNSKRKDVVFYVKFERNVLVAQLEAVRLPSVVGGITLSELLEEPREPNVQHETLMHFHE
jgi:hypothetical protein